jgi:hypothetical protein
VRNGHKHVPYGDGLAQVLHLLPPTVPLSYHTPPPFAIPTAFYKIFVRKTEKYFDFPVDYLCAMPYTIGVNAFEPPLLP